MEKKTMTSDKDLLWFLECQDDEMDNEVIPQTEVQPVPVEETTTDVEMKKDSITQGEADIASEQSEHTRNTENVTVQKRINAKMRKKTLEAYKQAYLVPTKLNNQKAVYLSRETQERTDFIVRISYDIQKQSTVSKNHSTDFFIQSSEIMSIDE